MTMPTMPWNRNVSRSEEALASNEDQLNMIPAWSVVLAIAVFAGVQYLFHGVMPHHKQEMLPMRLLMGYAWGTAFASYILLVGYVSRDVKRRRMPAGLWMLIVVSDAGRHRRGGVLHSAAADSAALPTLPDRDYGGLPLLPAVPVPIGPGVRAVLPWCADHGCVLCAVRTRPGRGPRSGEAAGV